MTALALENVHRLRQGQVSRSDRKSDNGARTRIDPDKLAESAATWQTAKAELTAWYEAQALVSLEDKQAARKAAKMAKKAARAARKSAVDQEGTES